MSVFFDDRYCEEEQAEGISDTERANFRNYFKPKTLLGTIETKSESTQTKADFEALFGDPISSDNQQEHEGLSAAEIAEKN